MIPHKQENKEKVIAPSRKITSMLTDVQLYENAMKKAPYHDDKSGDLKYPGIDGLYGEWIVSLKQWTEGRFYVSAIRGYERSKRMTLAKAWLLRALRMGKL
jgi:hypothetical protein